MALALAASTSACESSAPATYVARDSTGVRIVESTGPAWATGAEWSLAQEPRFSIGAIDGPPETTFSGVVSVLRLDNGTMAVVDRGSAQIRFFTANGEFVRAFGAPGDGPGEFAYIRGVGVLGDSIWISDAQLNRLTVVHASSDGFRSAALQAQRLALGAVGTLPDGSLILGADLTFNLGPGNMPANGLQRFDAAYVRVARTGETLDTLVVATGRESILRVGDGTIELLQPLFGRSVSHAIRAERLLLGDQERYEILAYDSDGTLVEITRRLNVDLTVTDAARREALDAALGTVPEESRPQLRTMYEGMEIPPTRPAFRTFLVDPSGHLWIQDFVASGVASTWSVFAPEGAWLGVVTFAEGFLPMQVLEDEVIGVWRDELDVEYVRSYALTRP